MRRSVLLASVFVTGVVVGGLGSAFAVSKHWQHRFAEFYAIGVQSQAFTAIQIHRGQEMDLFQNAMESLPAYVLAITDALPETDSTQPTLQLVREAYTVTDLPIPSEIQPVLHNLPERPPGNNCSPPDSADPKG